MKTRSLILLGLVSCLFFAVVLMPASLLWRWAGSAVAGLPVTVERVGGTVWNGFLEARTQGVVSGPLQVKWDVQGWRLLLGEVALELAVEGPRYRLQGRSFWGLWGKGIAAVQGDVQAALLEQVLGDLGVSMSGAIQVQDLAVHFTGNRVGEATGQIAWSGGPVAVRSGASPRPVDFPGVKGVLSARDGDLIIAVSETRGNQPLGELSLLPEQGLAGVKVLKRVLSLAGFEAPGEDDKVLLNLQQPLPF